MNITPPRRDADHPDYQIECEEVLDIPLRDLIDMAVAVGWLPERVFDSIASLIDHQRLAYAADPDPADDKAASALRSSS